MIKYTPWKMSWIFQRPHTGSKCYYGNFTLGLEVDSHPRLVNIIFCFIVFEIGISFTREGQWLEQK